ncbi:MAG: hypothetical protein Q8L48_37825 [Archangium sp.]|nr:hypothetical protein [Archangium sp.]
MRTVLLLCALSLVGCQKTNREVLDAAKPAWAAVRTSLPALRRLVNDAPPEGKLDGVSWTEADTAEASVSFLTAEQLGDPDVELDEGQKLSRLDLYEGGNFLNCLQWTGPRSPMSPRALDERNGDSIRAQCDAGLATKYLVVLDTIKSTLPVLTGEGVFAGGEATVRVTVIDRLAPRALVTFTVDGKPGEKVRYEVRPGEEKEAKLAQAVHSTMWGDAKRQIFEGLRQRGATITPR